MAASSVLGRGVLLKGAHIGVDDAVKQGMTALHHYSLVLMQSCDLDCKAARRCDRGKAIQITRVAIKPVHEGLKRKSQGMTYLTLSTRLTLQGNSSYERENNSETIELTRAGD